MMDIVQKGQIYLIDDRWYSPTNNKFLINRMLDRVRSSVSYAFAKPTNSIDDRFMDVLREDHVLIDIGATTGEYTVGASLRVSEVHSLEASPLKHECLEKNIQLHHLNNVTTYNYAVSDTSGELEIYDDNDRIFGGSVYSNGNSDQCFKVDAVTLDGFVKHHNISPDVLKLTVNGHEPEILKGATDTLKSLKYILFQSARHEEIVSYLQERGYEIVEERVSCKHDALNKITKIVLLRNSDF